MSRLASRFPGVPRRRQVRGAIAVMAALLLPLLLAFAALAVDIGRLLLVHAEMRNAADAAALAGAADLRPAGGAVFPDWESALRAARRAVSLNRADGAGAPELAAEVRTGWFNVDNRGPVASPLAAMKPSGGDYHPAVMVTTVRADGQAGGALALFLGALLGIAQADVRATSIAFLAPPAVVAPGTLFPFALNRCLFDAYWDMTENAPRTDPATGEAFAFAISDKLQNNRNVGPCPLAGGHWTAFFEELNNVPVVKELVENGNPAPVAVGDRIWIEPGAKATIFGDVAERLASTAHAPLGYLDVVMPVVDTADTHTRTGVLAFGAFRITRVDQGEKTLHGHFLPSVPFGAVDGSSGVSSSTYGVLRPPALGQ